MAIWWFFYSSIIWDSFSKFNADGVEIKEEETGAIITGTSGEKYIYLGELLYGDSSTTHSCLDKTNHKANIKTVFATCYNEAGEIISSAELALK